MEYGELFKSIYPSFWKEPFSDISFERLVIDDFFLEIIKKLWDNYNSIIGFIKLCYTDIDCPYFHKSMLNVIIDLHQKEILLRDNLEHIFIYFNNFTSKHHYDSRLGFVLQTKSDYDVIIKKYYWDYITKLDLKILK